MPGLLETQEMRISANPDRLIMLIPSLKGPRARNIANTAVREARRVMPKLTGRAASRLFPLYGTGFFGVGWQDPYVWFQEQGIRGFTMWNLAGKTIPMWVDDPTGEELQRNPKAKTRMTMSGKPQVLIFRRAALPGTMKTVRRKVADGTYEEYQVSASYPGAPGRIGSRQAGMPMTTEGKTGGQIASGNIGVRWRHPGLAPRLFLNHAMTIAAQANGISPQRIYAADRGWRSRF
jgi:hypothetical protein